MRELSLFTGAGGGIIKTETRNRMSESAKARCTPEWRIKKSLSLCTEIDVEQVRSKYINGMTQLEVAESMGVSRKVVERVMRQYLIPRRKAIKRNQWGDKNHKWKGDLASLGKLHARLDRRFGKPKQCKVCGTTDESKTYDWANLTGRYANINDFKRMCRSCHWKYDKKHLNFKQLKK